MDGEEIFGIIIMVFSNWLCAAIFCGIAFSATKQKTPMSFWSGTTVDPRTISDIPAYNRENARMWYIYSGFFWLAGIVAFFHMMASTAIMMITSVPGIFFLVMHYNRILKKYQVR